MVCDWHIHIVCANTEVGECMLKSTWKQKWPNMYLNPGVVGQVMWQPHIWYNEKNSFKFQLRSHLFSMKIMASSQQPRHTYTLYHEQSVYRVTNLHAIIKCTDLKVDYPDNVIAAAIKCKNRGHFLMCGCMESKIDLPLCRRLWFWKYLPHSFSQLGFNKELRN